MSIEEAISKLLYQYDEVIVPGMGTFTVHYQSASIQPVHNVFNPPAKVVSFDPEKKPDDGLLVRYLSETAKYPRAIAEKMVSDFVTDCFRELAEKTRIQLEYLGVLYLDSSSNLCFIPDTSINYHEDSFGLPSFQVPYSGNAVKGQPAKQTNVEQPSEKKKRRASWPAVVIPLIFTGVLIVLYIFDAGNIKSRLAGINDDGTGMPSTEKTVVKSDPELKVNDTATKTEMPDETVDTGINKAVPTSKQAVEDSVDKPAEIPDESLTAVEPKTDEKRYYIVAGCFRSPEKAESMVAKLNNQGFNSSIFGTTNGGLHMVCYSSFEGKRDALNYLDSLRQRVNPDIWLIRK